MRYRTRGDAGKFSDTPNGGFHVLGEELGEKVRR